MMSSALIWGVIALSSLAMLAMRITGYLIPPALLSSQRLGRITTLFPIVLLAALVSVQTLVSEGQLTLDHRLAGVVVGAIALSLRASFPVVMLSAGLTGALIYNYL
jgi:branched-subunit amino acid transport protein AzlD